MRASLCRQDGHEWVGVWRLDAPVVSAETIEGCEVVLRIVIEDSNAALKRPLPCRLVDRGRLHLGGSRQL